jgi:hypothetical protein
MLRVTGKIRNVSREGVGLLLDQELEPGTVLKVELAGADEAVMTVVLACVVYASPVKRGQWLHGCAFVSELSDAELQHFGAQKLRSGEFEHRAWVRFPCDLEASYRLVRVTERELSQAKVVDLSASGTGLVVDRPIEAGSLVNIVLTAARGQYSLKTLACVVRVTERQDGTRVLGCNFIRELNERELNTLLPKPK